MVIEHGVDKRSEIGKDALLAFASAQETRPDLDREDALTLGVVFLPRPFSPALLAGLAWSSIFELPWA